MAKGECGECTVCCTLSVVPDYNKKAGETCTHCKNNSCSVYNKRPQVCKDFECAYLQGGANIELRPDKCGIMFFRVSDRIFTGALVPDMKVSDTARGQVEAFKQQGFSVVLLKLFEKPFLDLANGHDRDDIWREYVNILMNGNV